MRRGTGEYRKVRPPVAGASRDAGRRARSAAIPLGFLLAAALVLGGCRAEVSLRLKIDRSGSVEASLALYADQEVREASKKLTGRPLLSLLDLEPLTSNGWSVGEGPLAPPEAPWAAESIVLQRRMEVPDDLSPAMGAFTVAGKPLFESLSIDVRDEPHRLSYRLSGRVRLPALDVLLPPIPRALTEAAAVASTDSASPPLLLVLRASVPGAVTAHNADETYSPGEFVWRVSPGEEREVMLESRILKTRRLGLWAGTLVLSIFSVGLYMAARRRSDSTSLSK